MRRMWVANYVRYLGNKNISCNRHERKKTKTNENIETFCMLMSCASNEWAQRMCKRKISVWCVRLQIKTYQNRYVAQKSEAFIIVDVGEHIQTVVFWEYCLRQTVYLTRYIGLGDDNIAIWCFCRSCVCSDDTQNAKHQ